MYTERAATVPRHTVSQANRWKSTNSSQRAGNMDLCLQFDSSAREMV